jgi:hypothetical protein
METHNSDYFPGGNPYAEKVTSLKEQFNTPELRIAELELEVKEIKNIIDSLISLHEKNTTCWETHLELQHNLKKEEEDFPDNCVECYERDCDDCPYVEDDIPESACDSCYHGIDGDCGFENCNEYPIDKLEPQETKVTFWNEDKTELVTIKFPSVKAALEFTELNSH